MHENAGDIQPHKGHAPPLLKVIQLGMGLLGRVTPGLTGQMAYRMWFATRRFNPPAREQTWAQSAQRFRFDTAEGPVAVYRWGETGPRVLLVHGWNGRATQLGAFAEPLVQAGYQVLAFDAPAHGVSPGNRTTLFKIATVLQRLGSRFGPVDAVIAHSFGTAVVLYAMRYLGFSTQKIVSLSAPAQMQYLFHYFNDLLRLPGKVRSAFQQRLFEEFGNDLWHRLSPELNVADLAATPALLLHDDQDFEVIPQQAILLHEAWPGSRLVRTQGLGHRRILRDPDVVQQVVEFIAASPDA